jgi:biotin operon repressor
MMTMMTNRSKERITAAGEGHKLGKVQQFILIEMEHRATPEGLVQISRADLAALTGSSESSIKWLMRSLKERGLIRVVTPHTRGRNVGQPPVYQLTYMQRMNRGQEEDAEQKG